jgi:ceramide glucosyltransferase
VFLNIFYSKWAGTLAYFGKTAVVGKGLLLRKEAIKNIGGLESISPYLAEDFMVGKLLQEKGYKTVLSAHGVSEIVGHQDMRAVYNRHLRWGLIRKTSGFVGFLLEPITYPIISSVMGGITLNYFFQFSFFPVFAINLLFFLTLDLIQFKNFSKKIYALTPLAWFAKEIVSLVLWVDILKSNSIYWRNKKFFLSKNSRLVFD